MDYLLRLLHELIQNQQLLHIAFVSLTGLTILALTMALGHLVSGMATPLRRRLQALRDSNEREPLPDAASGEIRVDPMTKRLLPRDNWQHSPLRRQMVHAGYHSETAVSAFLAARIFLALLLPAGVVLASLMAPQIKAQQVALYAIIGAGVGFILPGWILDRLATQRKIRLRNGFPDALDLLVVCVESGLGLNAAISRVSDELDISHPELASELNLVSAEIRAGVDRVQAMKNLAVRTGLDEIRGLVALLDQTLRFGTSIAGTLRIYSEEFRDKRIQRAEEVAATIGTKMIFPLTFCLWPAFFLVVIGPAVLGVLEVLQRS